MLLLSFPPSKYSYFILCRHFIYFYTTFFSAVLHFLTFIIFFPHWLPYFLWYFPLPLPISFLPLSSSPLLPLSSSPLLPLSSTPLLPHHPSSPLLSYLFSIQGMGDVHDGVNFMRAACVIAVEKAKASFEPMLEVCNSYTFTPPLFLLSILYALHIIHSILIYSILIYSIGFITSQQYSTFSLEVQFFTWTYDTLPQCTTQALRHRSVHIMHRLFPIVEFMVRKGGNTLPLDTYNKPCQDMVRQTLLKLS